jgi:hypothetical protein
MAQDAMMKMMMNKKKQGKSLSDSEKKSKLEALMGMKGLADSHMGNKLKNLKKVTVASNSPQGLKAGLHKAEDLADQSSDDSNGEMSDDTHAGLEDSPDMMDQMSKFSDGTSDVEGAGSDVYDKGDMGGHVARMPKEFDTDADQAVKEARDMEGDGEEHPDGNESQMPNYDAGTFDAENNDPSMSSDNDDDSQPESVDQIVQDAQHLAPDELQELIQKLQEQANNS